MRKVMSKDIQTIQERFENYIANNPKVVDAYLRFAREVMSRGYQRYSTSALTERCRWHFNVEIKGNEQFKISNDYRSRMARYLMEKYPDLNGLFRIRSLRSA
jgi:hypothetical protein